MFPSRLIYILTMTSMAVVFTMATRGCPHRQTPSECCPSNCTCCLTKPDALDPQNLTINCDRAESPAFHQELHNLLARYPNVSRLQITETNVRSLENLNLCALVDPEELFVNHNSLLTLGEGEFICFVSMRTLNASYNDISSIAKDTFKGINTLQQLDLRNNQIQHIDPESFTRLKGLLELYIDNNPISSLDVWPLYLVVTLGHPVIISINNCQVSRFTNDLNWNYTCAMPSANGRLMLERNRFQHMTSFMGWGISDDLNAICLWRTNTFKADLAHNPLNCDCIDFEFYKSYKFVQASHSIDVLLCRTPAEFFRVQVIKVPLIDFVCHVQENCTQGCDCIERPGNITFHLNCQNNQMLTLPQQIPSHIGPYHYHFRYQANFRNNELKAIDERPYFSQVYLADFGQNVITNLTVSTMRRLQHLHYLYLDNNKLSRIPIHMQQLSFQNLQTLTLHGNQWSCSCEDRWFKYWLINMTYALYTKETLLCASPDRLKGRNVVQVPDEEFCTDPRRTLTIRLVTITVGSMGGVALLVIAAISGAYRVRVWLYTRFQLHPFDNDECWGEGKLYDVFVSYANEDAVWVDEQIKKLEAEGFKTFFHMRDFLRGRPITDNMQRAFEGSKRTICVLTPNFTASTSCMWEFTTALNHDLQEKKHRLVVILKDPVPLDQQDPSLRTYIDQFTYIEANNPDFWQNLLYSLSVERMGGRVPEAAVERGDDEDDENRPLLA